jgi:aminopeptidase C
LIAQNDNWADAANANEIIDSTIPPTDGLEAAVVVTLPANGNAYTAVIQGLNGGTGIGSVEVYDLDATADSTLANISSRGRVQTGDDVMIAGFIVTGTERKRILVRAVGPSLPVNGKLANPTLEIHGPDGLITSNDNWVDAANKQEIIDTTVAPTNDLESAVVLTLPANAANYTAIVRGVGDTTGVASVEVYSLD